MLVNEEIFDHNEVQDSSVNVEHICAHEPYISLAPVVIYALFSSSKANKHIKPINIFQRDYFSIYENLLQV